MTTKKMNVSELMDTDYRDYSMYVISNRAIPSAIDGLKPVQRKILYAAVNKYPKGKKIKVADLGGISDIGYHHGETSAQAAAVNMAAPWQNNVPVLQHHGNFGSRLVRASAAPRYIFASVGGAYEKYFVDTLVAPKNTDPDSPEPLHYLPQIPWVLVNGVEGIAVGFAVKILPRSPKDLKAAVTKVIQGKKIPNTITPTLPDFKGEVLKGDSDLQWVVRGVIEEAGVYGYTISELPIGVDRETYVTFLDKLCDEDKIKDYDDLCDDSGFSFKIKVSAAHKRAIKNPHKFFKLEKSYTENLTTIGHDGKLKVFDSVADLIRYFVDYRTKMYGERIKKELSLVSGKINRIHCKIEFVKMVINGKINLKRTSKDELVKKIQKTLTKEPDIIKSLISIPIYNFTTDMVSAMMNEMVKVRKEENEWKRIKPADLFLKTLGEI